MNRFSSFMAGMLLLTSWFSITSLNGQTRTVALWLFDEQQGLYPSCVLSDQGTDDHPLVLGPGGRIVAGRFGNALEAAEQPAHQNVRSKLAEEYTDPSEGVLFGYSTLPVPEGRTVTPMSWTNAGFCALMTGGEKHLRKEVRFPQVTATRLNLGTFDWTIEFWYQPGAATLSEGVVFEIGTGPRGENDFVTRLSLAPDQKHFILYNQPGGTRLTIPTRFAGRNAKPPSWHHLAFVYHAAAGQLSHFVDGKRQPQPAKCTVLPLKVGEEDYFSLGRDGVWERPLPGRMDELHFAEGCLYKSPFNPPVSRAADRPQAALKTGQPLLFASDRSEKGTVELGDRKHLFIDDVLIAKKENIDFTVHPPRVMECVIDSIQGPFRKHVSIVEDEAGLIRMYYGGPDDYLEVRTSRDGIHWEKPVLTPPHRGRTNYAVPEPTAMGNVFIDPQAPPQQRWKFISDFDRRGIFLYTSADGWSFTREKTAILPFRSGSQSNSFYDDQVGRYRSYHRSDLGATPSGKSLRMFVLTESEQVGEPWPFSPLDLETTLEKGKAIRLRQPVPHYLDNGPLTPSGFGVEYPVIFAHDPAIDPLATDIYVPKVDKYPWAPDTYIAFPLLYFHYEDDGPLTRQILYHPRYRKGSGTVETQVAVSRDGVRWKRYPRPAYVGIGRFGNHDLPQIYMAHGMVRRGDEIWQYFFGETRYHSSWLKEGDYDRAVYRTVQRLDGFVSADAPYDREGVIVTRPLVFRGRRLELNIDTGAAGYAQVGFLDELGRPIPGFAVDECVYINTNAVRYPVEWIINMEQFGSVEGKSEEELFEHSKVLKFSGDVSALQGKPVQIVFRLRGARLYAMQFTDRN